MECIKKIGWWIFKDEVVIHNYKLTSVNKFMSSSDTFHVNYKCKKCGATKKERFVEKDTLIKWGIPVEKIEKITDWNSYYPNKN